MEFKVLDESSGDAGIATEEQISPDMLCEELSEKKDHRCATDKFWCGFFLVIFTMWILSCQHAAIHPQPAKDVFHRNTTDYSTVFNDSTVAKNTSEFLNHENDNKTDFGNSSSPKFNETEFENAMLYFLLNLVTCNPTRLVTSIEKLGWQIVIVEHTAIAMLLLTFPCNFMGSERILREQPSVVGATLLFVALIQHLSAMFYASNSTSFSLLPTHEKLTYWIIPETLFLIICLSKIMLAKRTPKRDYTVLFPFYVHTIKVGIPVFIILELLIAFTISILQNVACTSILFYMIALGSCYVGFTIYYFGLMVISCAVRISSEGPQSLLIDPLRAVLLIARYHFGTACYHATLILPRLHTIIMVQRTKLKQFSKLSVIARFRLSKNLVHEYLTTLTPVYSVNYSGSVKKMLQILYDDTIDLDYFSDYGTIFKYIFMFLMGTNSLLIILLWVLGTNDPTFTMATWVMYIKTMIMFNLAIRCFKATSDAIILDSYRIHRKSFIDLSDKEFRIKFVVTPEGWGIQSGLIRTKRRIYSD